MKKNQSKNYSVLCYAGLVLLVIFLFLPPALRIFGKNLYVKEKVVQDVIEILQCNNSKETINSTFLNNIPQNLDYKIKGDYSLNTSGKNTTVLDDNKSSDEQELINEQGLADEQELIEEAKLADEQDKYQVMKLIRDYAQITYDNDADITTFKVKIEDLKSISEYISVFSTLNNQQMYFNSQQFYCEKITY